MVRVRWIDAQSDAFGWTPSDELDRTPCVVTSVGHLIAGSRPGHVTVALSWHPDGEDGLVIDSALHIPEGMVQSLESLTAKAA
jgi:hypothetical protein